MTFPTPEQEKQMLDEVILATECDGLLMGESVVQKLCGHVKALLAEIRRLNGVNAALQQSVSMCETEIISLMKERDKTRSVIRWQKTEKE